MDVYLVKFCTSKSFYKKRSPYPLQRILVILNSLWLAYSYLIYRYLISDYGNVLAAISDDFPIAEKMVGSAIKYGMEHSDYWFGKIFNFSGSSIVMNPVVPSRNVTKMSRSKDLSHYLTMF